MEIKITETKSVIIKIVNMWGFLFFLSFILSVILIFIYFFLGFVKLEWYSEITNMVIFLTSVLFGLGLYNDKFEKEDKFIYVKNGRI